MKAAVSQRQKPLLPARTRDWRPVAPTGRVVMPELPKVLQRGHDLDARLQRPKPSSDGTLERMFCISCGDPSGWVTTEVVSHAVYVCSACTATHGPLSLPRLEVPE